MTPTRHEPRHGLFQARLSPDGYLGLHPSVRVVTLLMAALVFGHIAEDVFTADTIVTFDLQCSAWFHAHATPALTVFFLFFTNLHGTVGVLALTLLFTLFLAQKGARDWILRVALAVPLGMLLNVLLENIFRRARPSFEQPLLTLSTYSFPSGHTAASTPLYGVVGAYLVCTCKGWRQALMVCLAAGMVALVGLSRIYLGAHYLSNVAAAIASSTGWLAIVFTSVAT
jgi:membrane-associated phospholipid phosphatase